MNKLSLKYLSLICCLGFALSCSTAKKDTTQVPSQENIIKESIRGQWIVKSFKGRAIRPSNNPLSLSIDNANHRFSGRSACNSFGGRILELSDSSIQMAGLFATKKACPDLNLENDYFNLLKVAHHYKIENQSLYLYDAADLELLSFYKTDQGIIPQQLHDIWLAKTLEGVDVSGLSKQPILEINLTRMDIMGNNGCNEIAGKIEGLSESNIRFVDMSMTEMYCEDHALSDRYSELLTEVRAFRLDERWLYFINGDGKEIIRYLKVD